MGTYSKGANGAFSGKVGSVVGSSWRSVDYLRSLPKKSSKQATLSQITQRAKFALAPLYLRPIKDILNVGFSDKILNKLTGYNAAVKVFLSQAIGGEYPDFEVDFSKIVMSKGSLSIFHGLKAEMDGTDLVLSWLSITNRFNSFVDDQLLVVLFNETKMMYLIYEEIERSSVSYTIELSDQFAGDTFQCTAFAIKREHDIVANSQYLGAFTIV